MKEKDKYLKLDQKILQKNESLGLSAEYDRDIYTGSEFQKQKSEFLNSKFEDNKIIDDPISGNKLHRSHKAAKNKYHQKNEFGEVKSKKWANYAAEVDHVEAVEKVYKVAKHNPFISDEEAKKIINDKSNFRVISKSLNASKQSDSDMKMIINAPKVVKTKEGKIKIEKGKYNISTKGKAQLVKENLKAKAVLQTKFTNVTVKNATMEAGLGAINNIYASSIPLTISAIESIKKVTEGELSMQEAAEEISKNVLEIAVIGGTKQLISDVIQQEVKLLHAEEIINKIQNPELAKAIQMAMLVQDSAIRCANGEITGEQFFEEIGSTGTKMVVTMVGKKIGKEVGGVIFAGLANFILPGGGTIPGKVVGEFIGEYIGGLIATIGYSAVAAYSVLIKNRDSILVQNKKYLKEINDYLNTFNENIKKVNEQLTKCAENQINREINVINREFNEMKLGIIQNDFSLLNNSLNKITEVFNQKLLFETQDDFDDFFFSDEEFVF